MSLVSAAYTVFLRPFKLKSLNMLVTLLEVFIAGHFFVFIVAWEIQGIGNYEKVLVLAVYDCAMALVLCGLTALDTMISLYKS